MSTGMPGGGQPQTSLGNSSSNSNKNNSSSSNGPSSVQPQRQRQPARSCVVCGKPALFMCSLCGPAAGSAAAPAATTAASPAPAAPACYCSTDCQTQHWAEHKQVCEGVARRRRELAAQQQQQQQQQQQRQSQQAAAVAAAAGGGTGAGAVHDNGSAATEEPTEEERMEDIKYSILQIFTIIKPVVICILLSVLWVKLSNPVEPLYDSRAPVFAAPSSVSVGTAFGTKGDGSDGTSVITALIILGQIVVATVVIACLFRYNQIKVIYGIFIFVVMLLLGYFGYVLGATLLSIAALSLDWITFVFFLWNLVAVGLAVIFWRGPMIIQQGYLVVMSSMMAFSLSTLPDLVTWILLGLLAVWDLIAVLCPFGPLRMLIESTGNGRDIPAALIYNAPMSMMASPGSLPSTRLPTLEPEPPRLEADIYVARASPQVQNAHLQQQPFAGQAFHGTTHDASQRGNSFYSSMDGPGAAQSDRSGGIELRPVLGRATSDHRPGSWDPQRPSRDPELSYSRTAAPASAPEPEAAAGQDVVEEDDNGVRLGLGDFVFYSVLVGRASLFDWITTVSTIVAVLAGLSMTIFLLGIYRKALPALPISIAFGIVFYLFSSTMLMPFTNNLTDLPMPLVVKVGDPSGLWVGKTGGGGMIFI